MGYRLKKIIDSILGSDPKERVKVLLLTAIFFLIIAGYTVIRETKDSIFSTIVAGTGRSCVAWAKIASMILLIPALFIHAQLVDRLKKHHLLYFYTILYGSIGLIFTIFLSHHTIGLNNPTPNINRIFGWCFYLFVEGYSPFVVGVFWAFVNSVTRPESVGRSYAFMIGGSKLGGLFTACLAYILLNGKYFNDIVNHQLLVGISSGIVLCVPIVLYLLIKWVPNKYLHGYEAAYKVEKKLEKEREKDKSEIDHSFFTNLSSVFSTMTSGLSLLFKYPYVMGIFGMTFFFELINQALKIENLVFGVTSTTTISQATSFLIRQAALVHLMGFFVVTLGTRTIINALGEKWSLLLVPTVTGCAVLFFVCYPTSSFAATVAFVITRSVNYAFSVPLRESLYIPTIKEVQFKSKSWIDGFGSKFAKTCAATFNSTQDLLSGAGKVGVQYAFFIVTIATWMYTSFALGKKFETVVKNNEVIGSK